MQSLDPSYAQYIVRSCAITEHTEYSGALYMHVCMAMHANLAHIESYNVASTYMYMCM